MGDNQLMARSTGTRSNDVPLPGRDEMVNPPGDVRLHRATTTPSVAAGGKLMMAVTDAATHGRLSFVFYSETECAEVEAHSTKLMLTSVSPSK